MISLVIPIYNQESEIRRCIHSLRRQRLPFSQLQILLVNDGSTDGSGDVCRKLAKKYPNILYLEQENRGVSSARNLGIRHAKGKYIFYLDADDELSPNTIRDVSRFFDRVYDQVDLVTYPIKTIYRGRVMPPHFQYRYLKETGVYDLSSQAYIGQTTMNIVVKNRFEQNVLFNEAQSFSEDQRYCCDVLRDKLKLGFCKKGQYIYYRSDESSSGRMSGSCFIFEQSMDFFESLFVGYEYVPLAFQGLYVYDLYWKMASNILFPYHYNETDFENAVTRIRKLLQKCYPSVILDHPAIDYYEKFYIMRLKGEHSVQAEVTEQFFALYSEGYCVYRETSPEMVITKVQVRNGHIRVLGFIKSVFFQFWSELPKLYVLKNDDTSQECLQLFPSAHDYYQSHEPTQRFFAMEFICETDEVRDFRFEMRLGSYAFPVHYYYMPLVPFSYQRKIDTYVSGGVTLRVDGENRFHVTKYAFSKASELWLYYDCAGVPVDNGKLQFLHDLPKRDGVERYYVISDERQTSGIPEQSRVPFGSPQHKKLLGRATKVVTAYIENNNIYPYRPSEYERYADRFQFETIYLQHGVLHCILPWKYSPERIMADKVVVSTEREARLFERLGFSSDSLWKTKMPRYEITPTPRQKTRRILYAPSWRSYLVGNNDFGKWKKYPRKFLQSRFYSALTAFLTSPVLKKMLNDNNYTLDVKLHPIFDDYRELLPETRGRVQIIDAVAQPQDYDLFLTDYSSYLYDFVYYKIPVISFIPDFVEFRCGMNGYRDLDYTPAFWEKVCRDVPSLIDELSRFFAGEAVNQVTDTFFEQVSAMDAIYKKMMED